MRIKKQRCVGKKSIHYNGSAESVELILRTVISVNQLSIYGVVADLRKELDPDSRNHVESSVIPTEMANTNDTSQSSTSLTQVDLNFLMIRNCRNCAQTQIS